MKIAKILIAVMTLAGFTACVNDDGSNPVYNEGEVYIYANYPESFSVTAGEEVEFSVMVSPNDESTACRWTVDGVAIGSASTIFYTFNNAGGPYVLRFEAVRDGVVNYRQYKLTVTP